METREELIQEFARLAKKEYNIEDDDLALKVGHALVGVVDWLIEEIKKSLVLDKEQQ